MLTALYFIKSDLWNRTDLSEEWSKLLNACLLDIYILCLKKLNGEWSANLKK